MSQGERLFLVARSAIAEHPTLMGWVRHQAALSIARAGAFMAAFPVNQAAIVGWGGLCANRFFGVPLIRPSGTYFPHTGRREKFDQKATFRLNHRFRDLSLLL
ncbi:MAG: hypothetical protein R3F10_11205 [Lysobacteraceae bacterium]